MTDPESNLGDKYQVLEQSPAFAQLTPEEQEHFRYELRQARRIEADEENRETRCEVWETEEAGQEAPAPKPKRQRRPRVATKQIEKTTGKTVSGVTVTRDAVTYTFGEPGNAAAEPNKFEAEAARLRSLKKDDAK